MSVEVRAVSGWRELRKFIDVPFRVHANHPLWVPLPKLERWVFLNRRLNAFFSHGGRVCGSVKILPVCEHTAWPPGTHCLWTS